MNEQFEEQFLERIEDPIGTHAHDLFIEILRSFRPNTTDEKEALERLSAMSRAAMVKVAVDAGNIASELADEIG